VLLLLTGSNDGTSDLIVSKLGERVFRFNFDLYNEYELAFTPSFWSITNPVGLSIDSNTVTTAFWWKVFNYYLLDEEQFLVEEVKYIFRELYHHCRLRGLIRGVPHDFHNHYGKLNILNIAAKYFRVPETLATFRLAGVRNFASKSVVAKSFSSGLTTTNKALFTTEVNKSALHPDFPWFLQEKIDSTADITIFICGDMLFAFERSRRQLKGLDWRAEQTFDTAIEEWSPFHLSCSVTNSVWSTCKDLSVDWGRMDLMRQGDELVFLEYNANGQWVFLDYQQKYGLLDAVTTYLTTNKDDRTRSTH
jgi:hypothetical protein